MNNLTIRQLRYFDALAKLGHFGRAAEVCSVSQPALSVQIKELEEQLGTTLFERGTRHVRLTSIGEDFALRVREILSAVDDLGDFARSAATQLAGRLRIGIIPTIGPYLLPQVIRHLNDSYPGLDIHIRETLTDRLIAEIQDGKIDVAIVALPVSEPSLKEVALFEETFLLVRPKGDEHAPVPNIEDLREMKLLLLEEGHCFRDQAIEFCNIQSAQPREAMDGSNLSTLVQMVGAGIGVTLIPEMAASVETRSADVSVSEMPAPKPSRQIGLIWRKTSPLDAQYSDLAQIIQDAVAQKI
jgi:LysR family hydrogen peroxide-inducible transcriptional activator